MMRNFYIVLVFLLVTACETLYEPVLDGAEEVMVVDARLVFGETEHTIYISKSNGFNNPDKFHPFTLASVWLIDSSGQRFPSVQIQSGVHRIVATIEASQTYQLQITSGDDIYVSDFEPVQAEPAIDSIYSEEFVLWNQPGGETQVESFQRFKGHRVYVDIDNHGQKRYYRFDSRHVLLYHFPFDTVVRGLPETVLKYGWKSIYPDDLFTIAAPSLYARDAYISKQPVGFFRYKSSDYLKAEEVARGWICLLYQYAISESTWSFYDDLNRQLGSEGKIFDPLYVQARGNLTCITNPEKKVLGNFEISRMREHRFYLRLEPISGNHVLRYLDDFQYISEAGQRAIYPPPFWQN